MFFFFNDTATTEIYTLSLHDALPISPWRKVRTLSPRPLRRFSPIWPTLKPSTATRKAAGKRRSGTRDRKSTRLNSSHTVISYAVFCLKKKKKKKEQQQDNKTEYIKQR